MPVFKNENNGTWYVMARYVNWKGERKQKCKRGFATKMLSRKLNDALSSGLFYAHFDSHRDISHFKSSCFCELFF